MEYIYNVGSTESEEYHYFRLELLLKETAVSQVDNTSTVAYRLRLYAGARYFYGYGLGASLVIDGKTVAVRDRENEPAVDIDKNGYLDIFQGETTLTHNTDGTLTVPVAFSIDMTAGYYTPGPMSGTGTLALSDIPRVSTLRATSANIGEVSMLAITRRSGEFTHSVRYTFGGQTGYVSATGEAVAEEEIFDTLSLGFLLPDSFYEEIPNAPAGICTLEISTYAGAVCIGGETAAFTVTASPALCAPTLTFTAEDCNPDTLSLTDDAHTLIRGYSIVRCCVDARGQKGAEVVSVAINGSPETEFLALTDCFTCVVTDSRGYTARQSLTLPIIDYIPLTCNVSVQRVDATGGQVRLEVWGQYYGGNLGLYDNTLTVSCDDAYIPCTVNDDTYRGEAILSGYSYQSAHTIQVRAVDLLSSIIRTTTVNRGVPVFDWGQEDFVFHVPVAVEGGINGVHIGSFSGSSLWLTPTRLPQSFFIAGGGVLGTLAVTEQGCVWQGTEGVECQISSPRCILGFAGDTEGIILSNYTWRQDD